MPTLALDLIQTVALAVAVLFAGYGLRRRIAVLDRFNIPAPVIGGFLFAALALTLRQTGLLAFEFDTTLQSPFMIAFFTTIGLGASFGLLRVGGPQVLLFWGLATLLVVLQNGVGLLLAGALGLDPLVGMISGSVTMTGGHGTGAAFGQMFEEQYQVPGGLTLALAAATFGLVSGGLLGGPIATRLIQRGRLTSRGSGLAASVVPRLDHAAQPSAQADQEAAPADGADSASAYGILHGLAIILVAMALGGLLSGWLGRFITLPAYIGAMIVAATVRNLDDRFRFLRIEQRTVDGLGTVALSLFLTMALMSLRLWELLDLAIPMLIILAVQVALVAIFAYAVIFRLMGRDFDAAVMAGGICGFGLGATPNAVANMRAIVERYGPAPRAFLVVPMVGAFFIDFTNALVITTFINFVR
ncbi:MAG: sodium/glutamate symporter [Gemmatimonadales bacterium]|nr:sodium/glutamate symporter [Gemmatimonadales bacterium]